MKNMKKYLLIILNLQLTFICSGKSIFEDLKEVRDTKKIISEKSVYNLAKKYFDKLHPFIENSKLLISDDWKFINNCENDEYFDKDNLLSCHHPGISFTQKINIDNAKNNICIIGDIHGCFKSFMEIIEDLIAKKYLDNNLNILKDNFYMFFTGDLVDRVLYGLETWITYLLLKINNPNNVFLCRGNHEAADQNLYSDCNFYDELTKKYNNADGLKLLNLFFIIYETLPLGIYVTIEDNTILFSHGGFDFNYNSKSFINGPKKFDFINNKEIVQSFLWTDFIFDKECSIYMNIRGFGIPAKRFIHSQLFEQKGIKAIFRGHQHGIHGLKIPNKCELCDWKSIFINQSEIRIADCIPIFTFSTAADNFANFERIVINPFYAILETSEDYNDWKLIPNELPALPTIYKEYSSDEDYMFSDEEIDEFDKQAREQQESQLCNVQYCDNNKTLSNDEDRQDYICSEEDINAFNKREEEQFKSTHDDELEKLKDETDRLAEDFKKFLDAMCT